MNESPDKTPSRRLGVVGAFIAAVIICLFILVPCTLREVGSRAVLGHDISMWRQVGIAVGNYHTERGHYPASLTEPDFQPYIDERVIAFLREGRITYYPPAPDSPPTFIIVHLATPRGDYRTQLDGQPLYPNSQ